MRKRALPQWCKEAKKALIDRDMDVTDLAVQISFSREYVSRVVNGSVYAPEIAARVSKALNLEVEYPKNII